MLLRSLEELFTTTEAQPVECKQSSDVVAYAIPTFQAPQRYFPPSVALSFPDHEQTLRNLLESARLGTGEGAMKRPRRGLTTRIATAYLNPTADFLELLARCSSSTWFLTAGPVSHGFAPKQPQQHQLDERKRARNVEDRSHGWAIPNVFRYAAQRAVKRLDRLQLKNRENSFAPTITSAQVGYYQRPGWTFHAKGMWLSFDENGGADRGNGLGGSQSTKREDAMSEMRSTNSGSPLTSLSMPSSSRLLAVCTGSGNFGARSARRDMESNLILIFPQSSSRTPLVRRHVEEWNRLCEHATSTELPETPDPPRWIRFVFPLVFPLIRSFF
jgi:phosphatidylserine/phosphatidylglycerophosphate/cardiolipin synthase-like enzyme